MLRIPFLVATGTGVGVISDCGILIGHKLTVSKDFVTGVIRFLASSVVTVPSAVLMTVPIEWVERKAVRNPSLNSHYLRATENSTSSLSL